MADLKIAQPLNLPAGRTVRKLVAMGPRIANRTVAVGEENRGRRVETVLGENGRRVLVPIQAEERFRVVWRVKEIRQDMFSKNLLSEKDAERMVARLKEEHGERLSVWLEEMGTDQMVEGESIFW